jgi:hypothetical protein
LIKLNVKHDWPSLATIALALVRAGTQSEKWPEVRVQLLCQRLYKLGTKKVHAFGAALWGKLIDRSLNCGEKCLTACGIDLDKKVG